METSKRSIAKAISWRVIASITTATITLLITGKLTLALQVGAADTVTKLFGYFLHERMWARIKYGLAKPPEYEI
jgi:uncharacterized membrane protein